MRKFSSAFAALWLAIAPFGVPAAAWSFFEPVELGLISCRFEAVARDTAQIECVDRHLKMDITYGGIAVRGPEGFDGKLLCTAGERLCKWGKPRLQIIAQPLYDPAGKDGAERGRKIECDREMRSVYYCSY